MKIQIGLHYSLKDKYYTSFLQQELIPHTFIDSIDEAIKLDIRILYWPVDFNLEKYSNKQLIIFTDNYCFKNIFPNIIATNSKSEYFEYENKSNSFKTKFLIDRNLLQIFSEEQYGCSINEDHKYIKNSGVIKKKVNNLTIISFPWKLNSEHIGSNSKYRPFYSKFTNKFYCEIGPTIDYSNLRRFLLHLLIKEAETYSIKIRKIRIEKKNLFAVRIDADGFSSSSFNTTLSTSKFTNTPFHWFIDIYSWCKHSGISRIKILKQNKQNVEIHSYRHMTYKNYLNNFINILTAKIILRRYKVFAKAIVSPFGFYTNNYQNVIKKLGFKYSSEFGFNVLDKPTYPYNNLKYPLQIPTNNASLTTLKLSGFTKEEAFDHLEKSTLELIDTNRIAILYEHPIFGIEKYPEEYKDLINKIKQFADITSLENYANTYQTIISKLYNYDENILMDDIEDLKENDRIPYENISDQTILDLSNRRQEYNRSFKKEYESPFYKWFFIWYCKSLILSFIGCLRKEN